MQVGLGTLLKRFLNRSSGKQRLGMALTDQGVHISVSEKSAGQWRWVKQHFIDVADWPQQLHPWVQSNNLQFCQCNLVLPASKYQIMQVERPAVEDSELAAALQWTVKDILSTQEELKIDYFELPAQPAGANKVSVVVASRKDILTLARVLHHAELMPDQITIEETVLLDASGKDNEAVVSLVQHAGSEVCLSIYKQGKIYFTRRIKGYELLSSLTIDELNNGMLEALATEVQRSMDYFESQLHQAGLRKVVLMLDSDFQPEIAENLKNLLFIDVVNYVPEIAKDDALVMRHAYITSVVASQLGASVKSAKKVAA